MIPLLSISQVKFIISSDTLVGYTFNENRQIALIFKEGEYYKELNSINNGLIKSKDTVIDAYKMQLATSNSLNSDQQKRLQELLTLADKNVNANSKLRKLRNFWLTTTGTLTLVVTGLIFIK